MSDQVTAKLYGGKVLVSGRVMGRDDHGRIRILVESVAPGDWPYPPKVGSVVYVRFPREKK